MSLAKEVEKYWVRIYFGSNESTRGKAEIWFKDTSDRSAGRIYFVDSKKGLSKDFVDRGGNPVIHLPFDMFHDVLDIIRNEKPLYLGDGFLSTSDEPVGEAE